MLAQRAQRIYSKDFQEIVEDPVRAKRLIEGSFCIGNNFINWRTSREFIADLLHKDGTILDIGCANGFLLRCLQEWSAHRLVPYGIDISELHIRQAKGLFAHQANNFACMSIEDISWLSNYGLPEKYDFVYCSITRDPELYNQLLKIVNPGGRLIIGFYGRNEHALGSPSQLEELQLLRARVGRLENQGCKFDGVVENPFGTGHIVAWVQC